jgi:hypothetical protein
MSAILESALDATRKAQTDAADAIQRAAAGGLRNWHGPNGGECPNTLDTLPVFLKYELTHDRCGSEVAEVIGVCISGHVLSAGNFDPALCAEWGRQCMQLRGGL